MASKGKSVIMESESDKIDCSTFEASTKINKKKRKLRAVNSEEQGEVTGLQTPKASARKSEVDASEKRLRVFRKRPPKTYLERLDRARTQRMFIIDRERKMSEDGNHEIEIFDIAGTTGNIYQVTITKQPSCTCPDAAKGSQCKHIVYILVNALKVPGVLAYQLAFLSTELASIFASAPVITQPSSERATAFGLSSRKPIEGDCPICFMAFEPEAGEIIWCRAACGNNIHRQCFEQWAASKPGKVSCVYCRRAWKGDEDSTRRVSKIGTKNTEGYVNVANELGLSGERDYSSYHQPWVRQHLNSRYC